MLRKRNRTPDEILKDIEDRKSRLSGSWEEEIILGLVADFVAWLGVLRFFFLASLLFAIGAYALGSMTMTIVFVVVALAFALGMWVDSNQRDQKE